MNKKLAAAMVVAMLPLTISAASINVDLPAEVDLTGLDEQTTTSNTPSSASIPLNKPATHAKRTQPRIAQKIEKNTKDPVVPIDLDIAIQQYDIVLPPEPVKMTADSIFARSADGYIQGRGNVDMQQGSDEIHAHYVEGNTKTQLFYVPGEAVWLQGDTVMNGTGLLYNGKTRGGSLDSMAGYVGPMTYMRGTDGEMYSGEGYMKKGLITTPHAVAKTPDYYLTGEDIHVYPGKKYTSENTKLWFKHVCLFTYGHYEGRLDAHAKNQLFSLFPRPHYTSRDGFGLYGGANYTLNTAGTLDLDIQYSWHTKSGFAPTVQLVRNSPYGIFRFGYISEETTYNTSHTWAKKFPEFEYAMPRFTFGSTGIYMDNQFSYGRWAEDGVDTGTHTGYRTVFSHRPIRLWKKANLRFFAGYQRDIYSTKDSMRRDPFTGVVLGQGINDKLSTTWWYTKHNLSGSTPYRFDTLDHPRQKGVAISYRLTPLDTFVLAFAKDLDTQEVATRTFVWVRDLHSFRGSLSWNAIDREFDVQIIAKDF